MLFNSVDFICIFLPLTLLAVFVLGRGRPGPTIAILVFASFCFYGYWNPPFLGLLVGSIAVNHLIAGRIAANPAGGGRWLALGVALNLLALGWFKYAGFLANTGAWLVGADSPALDIFLPLGISFFTFQQIAYLADLRQGKAEASGILRYALFVSFFPQLIAGPIVHHSQVMPQFARDETFRFRLDSFGEGVVIFLLGLAKKVVLADQFGAYADTGFTAAEAGATLTFFEGWAAALGYTFQLYFDFSGYSDMAIGLALMFNIRLPLNFNSPYKATSIIDFWRRWHMTLSAFLRDYLYIPLGGNRKGPSRRHVNLLATMLLGGLWHGAGWTFVIWGGLHGLYLVINHALLQVAGIRAFAGTRPGQVAGWALTFLAVVIAWVIFRAESLGAAGEIYRAMLGLNGVAMPAQVLALLGPLKGMITGVGNLAYLGDGTVLGFIEVFVMIALGLAICVALPHLHEDRIRGWRVWLLVPAFALTVQRVFFASADSPFLYFQF